MLFLACNQANFITVTCIRGSSLYQSVSFCIETTVSVTVCRSSSFSSCSAFSSNPAQRNLRMSMIISLEAVGVCFAGVSMIAVSLVLAFVSTSYGAASNLWSGRFPC